MPEISYANYVWFDPSGEQTFLFAEPPEELGITQHTLRSCALKGRKNEITQQVVRLRVCKLPFGGGLGTTVEEYHRFISAINSDGEQQ